MKKTLVGLALTVALFPFSTAIAATPFVELSAAKVQETSGAELGMGTKLTAGSFALKPQLVAFGYHGDTPGYRTDTMRNGQTRCRNTSTGYFANDTNCIATKVAAALKLELTYAVGTWGEIGVGARVAKQSTPYVTVSTTLSPTMSLKVSGGRDYAGLGVVFGH